ncbi:MAG: ABC transporter ATP-binding protein [Bacteroidetes bacterium]|nr:ABC transporter ATP-binding protein [Bacteroidota bacterium]MCY4204901.1 ABC transporter ATP-binding protein [Bacteroidota bacterium]
MITLGARGIGHKYGYRRIFSGIWLELNAGTILAITGVNGSGKSTLLKILAGVLQSTNGEILLTISEKTIPRERHSLHVGLVAPYMNVYEDLTLRENLTFIAKARSMSEDAGRIEEIISKVGLIDHIDRPVRNYSTGMLQRVRFAVALFHAPQVLLLDEPTLGLDLGGRDIYETMVANAQKDGHVVVIASNTKDDIALANRSLCIEDYAPSSIKFAGA